MKVSVKEGGDVRMPSIPARRLRWKPFAGDHRLLVWDMYEVVGGKKRACKNWTEAKLMRPDHVHYLPEGYILQGNLLYQALIKAYNDYVSH